MSINNGPVAKYIPAKGSDFCLLPNVNCDRSVYAQCSYVANRTLLRCQQIRRKDELQKNGGQCDQHVALRAAIKERFQRETIVLKNNCPPKSPRSRRYTKQIKSKDVVFDEDPALVPNSKWISESVDNAYRNDTSDRYRFQIPTVKTDKEHYLHQMILLKKEIDALQAEKRNIESKVLDKKRKRKFDCVEVVNLGAPDGEDPVKAKRICLYGHSDEDIVRKAVNDMMEKVSGEKSGQPVATTGCLKTVLPGIDYCIRHASNSSKKPMFKKCKDCDSFVIDDVPDGAEGVCPIHKHIKARPQKKPVAKTRKDLVDDQFSDEEFQNKRRPPIRSQVQFTTMPTGSRRQSMQMPKGPHLESARCRPFTRDYFPLKANTGRPNIGYSLPPRQTIQMRPPGQDLATARMVTVQRSVPFSRPYVATGPIDTVSPTIQRIATQDRQRNRLQQEEDMKAAASIADNPEAGGVGGIPNQYRVIRTQGPIRQVARTGMPQTQFRQGVPPNLAVNLATLPEEMKTQPLGSVLRQALTNPMSTTGPTFSGQPLHRQRLPVQTAIRKSDTPISSSVLTGIVRNMPATNPSQRHQIANVEVPVRRQAIPPHRMLQRPHGAFVTNSQARGPLPYQPTGTPAAAAPPRVIPLERNESREPAGSAPAPPKPQPLSQDFITELVDEGRISAIPPRLTPNPPKEEDQVEIVRKKTRPSLPLPKLPNVLSRSRPRPVPEQNTVSPQKSSSSSSVSQSEPVESPKKKERPPPRQGQRRSSRLDKSTDGGEGPGEAVADPLSLLADVSVAVRNPE